MLTHDHVCTGFCKRRLGLFCVGDVRVSKQVERIGFSRVVARIKDMVAKATTSDTSLLIQAGPALASE